MSAQQPYLGEQFAPVTPNLSDWDVVLLNSSGGKDSQTMIGRVVALADEQEVSRDRLVVVHAALGRVEWKGTLELVREQAQAYGLECRIVERPQGDLIDHIEDRGMFPGPRTRYCTSDHKRGQVRKVVTALDRERRIGERFKLLNCMGLRSEESPARRKKVSYAPNAGFSTKTRTVWDWLPIHDLSEREVWRDVQESGVRHHEAYDLGMPRLSCVFCVFAPKDALILAARHNPELLDEYVSVEARIGHRFRLDVSMAEIKREVERGYTTDDRMIEANWNIRKDEYG